MKARSKANRSKRFLASLLSAGACLLAFGASGASAFGIVEWDGFLAADEAGTTPATQAGSHPFSFQNKIVFPVEEGFPPFNEGDVKDAFLELPVGFTANPNAVPQCRLVDFFGEEAEIGPAKCPNSTAVGTATIGLFGGLEEGTFPVFNMVPSPGEPAKLGFKVLIPAVFIDPKIRSESDYGTTVALLHTSEAFGIASSDITLWGVPHDPAHDEERGSCMFVFPTGESCPAEIPLSKAPPTPLFTLQSHCSGPLEFPVKVNSWQEPDFFHEASFSSHDSEGNPVGVTGCEKLPFAPKLDAKASTDQAETGSGLEVSLDFDDQGLLNPEGLAQSTTEKAVVTLPEGVTINPSVGEGLGVCTPAQYDKETVDSKPGAGCPDASKLGTLGVETPLTDELIEGSVFLAQQDDPATAEPGAENPFDSLIALYAVLKSPRLGVIVKQPMKVEPDEQTGQLVSTIEDIPQIPFSSFRFKFREGARAPLVTPPACGTYRTVGNFYPHSDPGTARTVVSEFEITKGLGGGPCPPGGVPPFEPSFEAGSTNNNAASFSPFSMRLIREDGEQDMTKFSSVLPPGVLGSLAGVEKCSDAAVGVAKAKTGREEIASPSCPPNSLIGHSLAGAGVGGALTYVDGQLYLAGPYKGAPLSVISITPALAGPFDAGTVVVRLGLTLNPKTAEVEVDGAASDPIPHILQGIVLKVRDLRVYVDRDNFILNPTSCDPSSAKATLFGSFLDVFDPNDDVPVDLATRYQAANCLNLGFKPKLGLRLKGGTRRGGHPGLRAVYTPRKGDANIEDLVVRLPRSAFLDQAHIRTICTRVQFAAEACPKAAQYGYIRAWTPLLDEPLQGPVWLRSSNNKLPDMVFDLKGLVDVEVAVRIDSAKGGIRATMTDAPDAPLSRVVLNMQGGKKGLIVNSTNLCKGKHRAKANLKGQNGKLDDFKPLVKPDCGKKGNRKQKGHHKRPRVAKRSAAG